MPWLKSWPSMALLDSGPAGEEGLCSLVPVSTGLSSFLFTLKKKDVFNLMYMDGFAYSYACVPHAYSAHRGWKKVTGITDGFEPQRV